MANYIGEGSWLSSSSLSTPLMDLLRCEAIEPGDSPSYQICKVIYEAHPIGKKMVDAPITLAMSQQREISVSDGPEDRVRRAFADKWKEVRADAIIANHRRLSRIYGVGTLALVVASEAASEPLDLWGLHKKQFGFNVLDPLNTSAGTNVFNQDPNTLAFQNPSQVRVGGKDYHVSRTCILQNESPLYISYTSSSFGFLGRSVYQRALYPLKSYVQAMRTDDLVTRKVGVIIAKIKQVGSIVDNVMSRVLGGQRQLAKEAETNDVLSIGSDDDIQSMNLQNLEGPYTLVRRNMLENLALSGDMPAKLLNSETFAEGFGEGTEDAKMIAKFVEGERSVMQPSYDFMDNIVQYLAWTPEFYETIQRDFPEYTGVDFKTSFYRWKNSFTAIWPSYLIEPDSERIKVDDVRLKAIIALAQVLIPIVDPESKGLIVQWIMDNINDQKLLFKAPLLLDIEAIANYVPPMQEALQGDGEKEPDEKMNSADSAVRAFSDAVAALPDRVKVRAVNRG